MIYFIYKEALTQSNEMIKKYERENFGLKFGEIGMEEDLLVGKSCNDFQQSWKGFGTVST